MTKKILLINSDLANNRGDRAIAEGNIELLRTYFNDAHITGISQHPKRDKDWYGIDFLDMSFQSVSPYQLFRLCIAAKKHDLIFWGGGEILKDYTNKAALWYWVGKITIISLFNKNIIGTYHGIGPTKSTLSKKLIAFVVGRCKAFIVRDDESLEKLRAWGVPDSRLIAASDPAVLPKPQALLSSTTASLCSQYNVSPNFFDNFICIGPRDWFHYKPNGVLPYKYHEILYSLFGNKQPKESPNHKQYIKNLSKTIQVIAEENKINILFVPMHMEESDTTLCELLAGNVNSSVETCVLKNDNLSPSELRSLISGAKAMIGFRLHSNIIGISSGVPSLNIYYVDKGRVFFDQIKQSKRAIPIELVLENSFPQKAAQIFNELLVDRDKIHQDITKATKLLRGSVQESFKRAIQDV